MTARLRVVHVVRSDAFAGVERYICGVANELAARGHEVRVVGGAPARMHQELKGTVSHLSAASTYRVARALARDGGRDIVHAHMTAAELAALAASPLKTASIVSTRHFPDRRLAKLPPTLGRFMGARLTAQISVSDFVAASIGEPSIVIHNGVARRPQADLGHQIVVMLQRLQPEKAPAEGLEAWARSGLGSRGWTLVIAGSGNLDASLRELALLRGVRESVSFLGHVSLTDELVAGASVLLAPAPAEPFGLSVVEAMAHGVPVVAARGGAHVETVGDDGFLFEPGDIDAAAASLVRLADNPELRVSVGRRLRARQNTLFSLDEHVSRLEELYRSIVRGN